MSRRSSTSNATADLRCRDIAAVVTEYLDGLLDATVVAAIDAHLADCGACTAYLDQFRTTVRLTGRLREVDVASVPGPVREELVEAFRAAFDG